MIALFSDEYLPVVMDSYTLRCTKLEWFRSFRQAPHGSNTASFCREHLHTMVALFSDEYLPVVMDSYTLRCTKLEWFRSFRQAPHGSNTASFCREHLHTMVALVCNDDTILADKGRANRILQLLLFTST